MVAIDHNIIIYLVPNYSADVDECTEMTHMCTQNCHNSVGSYVCTCDEGFVISSNGTTCIGEFVVINTTHDA